MQRTKFSPLRTLRLCVLCVELSHMPMWYSSRHAISWALPSINRKERKERKVAKIAKKKKNISLGLEEDFFDSGDDPLFIWDRLSFERLGIRERSLSLAYTDKRSV